MAGGVWGKHIVFTGRFESISGREAGRRLAQAGGVVSAAVSDKTDALFAGQDHGANYHQAQIRGVPILDEAALVAVLAGGDLDALIARERSKPAPVLPDDALAQFTALDLTTPTRARWEQITTLLDRCGPELAEVAVDYLTEATEHWDGDLELSRRRSYESRSAEVRRAPRAWVDAILRGEDHPKYRLVRILDLSGLKLTGKVANHLFDCPHLANLRLLRLDDNPTLPATFFKNLADAPLFAHLTHLPVRGMRLNKSHVAALATAAHLRNLTHLGLTEARFDSDESLATLLDAPTWAELQCLDYRHVHARYTRNSSGLAALVANPAATALRSLHWAPCDDADLLADLLRKYAATLERLRLEGDRNTDVVPAFTATDPQRLTHLAIHDTALGGNGVEALAQHPALRRLEVLSFAGVGCDDEGISALAAATGMTGLRSLTLSENAASDGALAQLLSSPQLRDVVELDLAGTDFGPASVDAICSAPLAALQRLDITGTQVMKADLARLIAPGALPALEGLGTDLDLPAKASRRFVRWR